MAKTLKARATTPKNWVPVRRGDVYCSPACGGDCKHAEFVVATRKAKGMCRRLGPGWEPVVFENLGWHWCAKNGELEIAQHADDTYTGWLNPVARVGGMNNFLADDADPVVALAAAVRQAGRRLKALQKTYDEARRKLDAVLFRAKRRYRA